MTEEWRQIENYPNYQVSSLGRIRSSRKILKATPFKSTGYMRVTLYNQGEGKTCTVHRLVAGAFLDLGSKTVNHISGDKSDNTLSNLECVTQLKNNIHAYATGLKKRILSEEDVIKIRQLRKNGIMNKDIASVYGVAHNTVSMITTGRRR